MKEIGSAFEEAKADVAGLFALQFLIDKGAISREMENQMYVTFLASAFRSLRFGIAEAHGRGMALQLSYLLKEGAFSYNEETGRFSVNFDQVKRAVRKLTGEMMIIQAQGNYEKAKEMLNRMAVLEPSVQRTLDKLTSIPVDIEPVTSLNQE